jgi:hypothetical protein
MNGEKTTCQFAMVASLLPAFRFCKTLMVAAIMVCLMPSIVPQGCRAAEAKKQPAETTDRSGQGRPGIPDKGGFKLSYKAGGLDGAERVLGGTEIIHLAAYAGKLYAANGMWMDESSDNPRPGPQILVLDRPDGKWQLEHQFGPATLRITTLVPVTFTTDAMGHTLENPVSMLLAAPTGRRVSATVYSRDDASGAWTATGLSTLVGPVEVRSLLVHRDQVTRVDCVLAGSSPAGIVRGVYDPAAPGRIRWDKDVELPGVEKRVMAMAQCNGVAHALVSTAMYRRSDGPHPKWEMVYTSSVPVKNPKNSGLRGLTAIPNPAGNGEVLLATLEGPHARVLRLDPAAGYKEQVELDLIGLLRERWGVPVGYAIVAYNNMVPVTDPRTHEKAHLLGLEANYGANASSRPNFYGWEVGGWYLIRHADQHYELRQIVDPALKPMPTLIAARTFAVSPFATDGGHAVYFGGYDANFKPAHNTAWIFRGDLAAVFGWPRR